jgi:N-acetyl-anhydromuramyl-L-alanine amidase AmpD
MKLVIKDITGSLPRHKTRKWKKRKKIDTIVVHTTASRNQNPHWTARYHITPGLSNHISKKGCPAIVYHDFITKEGIVWHCNDYWDKTWHASAYNRRSIGVTMAYRGQTPGVAPSIQQYDSLIKLLVVLCLKFKILPKRVIGHREVPGMWTLLGNGSKKYKKVCPGMAVDLNELRAEVTERVQRQLAAAGLYDGPIDGIFGRKSKKALKAWVPLQHKTFVWKAE